MAHVLVTDHNPLHFEEPLPSNLELYEDDEKGTYIVKEKESGDILIEMPKSFPPD
jgi:hypothetical protein